ncbi:MAG: hypothetical protein E7Z92_01100 [Cyanobacteria bacterium SIG31]|nr:hypothetical protein [Cyanobacteria bacterium SIG31]
MQINNQNKVAQNNIPSFGSRMIKPSQFNKVPYASIPLSLGALATLGMAKLFLDKKEENSQTILSADEFEQTLIGMKKSDGSSRFEEYDIKHLKLRYDEFPVILSKMTNLKSKDGNFVFDNSYDIISAVEKYKKHPEFSEYVIREIQSTKNIYAGQMSHYLKIDSENSDFLLKLYNRRNEGYPYPALSGCYVSEIMEAYEKNPEFCQFLLDAKSNDIYHYSGYNIPRICKEYEKNPALVSELTNLTNANGTRLDGYQIEEILSYDKDALDFYLSIVRPMPQNNIFVSPNSFKEVYEIKQTKPEFIEYIFSKRDAKGNLPFETNDITEISKLDEKKQKYVIEMVTRGIPYNKIKTTFGDEIEKGYQLLNKGMLPNSIHRQSTYKDFDTLLEETQKPSSPLNDFLSNPDNRAKIKEFSAGKYQKELMRLFEPDKIPYVLASKLMHSDLSVEDFLNSLRKISKSSFKLAYDTPNQYLSGLRTSLSTPINGHYPELDNEELSTERNLVLDFFINNFVNLARLLKYVDNDTVNHMMDKRFEIFAKELELMSKVSNERMELLNKLLQCKSQKTDKALSVKEKLQLCEIVKIFHIGNISNRFLEEAVEKGAVNVESFKEIINQEILKKAGVENLNTINKNVEFNKDYLYLMLNSSSRDLITEEEKEIFLADVCNCILSIRGNEELIQERKNEIVELLEELGLKNKNTSSLVVLAEELNKIFNNMDKYSDDEIITKFSEFNYALQDYRSGNDEMYTLIRGTLTSDFKEFISDTSNKYGKANLETKEIFAEKNLNHKQWLKTDLEEIKFQVAGKNLSIKMWDRNPLEDLFMGNKTTCCTAIGRTNGGSTPVYIMGECWNVVQMYDEKGDLVGMSRIFVGENNGECSIMMDNIELNNNFTKNMTQEEKVQIRNQFFKYIHQLAEKVMNKKDAKVYFYRRDTHVNTDDLNPVDIEVDFIGKNPTDSIYVNSAGMKWINPKKLKNQPTEWFEVPKQ